MDAIRPNTLRLQRLVFFMLCGLALVQLLVFAGNHYFLRTYAFDYSAYNFAFYDYAHFRVSPCPIYMFPFPVTFLQDHFSLTLMFFLPLYWLLAGITGTYTLLIIQWAIVLYGAWGTYKLIYYKTEKELLALLATLYYFLLLGRYTAAAGDCNLAIMGAAFVPVFLYYFEKQNKAATLLCFLLLVFNREDFALWLIFISVFLIILHRREKAKLRFSALLLGLSIVFFMLMFAVFIPAVEDENKKYTLFNFAVLGKTPREALAYMFHDPVRLLQLLFINHSGSNYYDGVKQEFYVVYLLSGGFLLLFRPAFIIPFIPIMAKKMYNDDPHRWSMESFYSVEIVSLLPILVFTVIADLKWEKLKPALAWLVCGLTLIVTGYEITKPAEAHIALMGDTKKFNFLSSDFYKSDYDIHAIYDAMKLIPDTASVSASGRLSQHLAYRKKIYYFPRIDDAQYVFVIKKNDNWPVPQEEADKIVDNLIANEGWQVLADQRDFRLIKKSVR